MTAAVVDALLVAAAFLAATAAAWWFVNITLPTVRYWRSRRKESP